MSKRPPIVTVLGHVDHGKTTLLDVLRESSVAEREAGGITQGIGASKISTKEGLITFIDTPGHKAFSQMRGTGATVADIALLVVAADDGPKPQTKEALSYLLETKTPYIVVLTKVDMPSAQVEVAKAQLEEAGVLFEGRGGDVPFVEVSSKEKTGFDELIEMIQLVSEVNEIEGDPKADLDARVIETNKDKRGVVVALVVRNGSIKRGDEVFDGEEKVKAKGLFDEFGKAVSEVGPGDPVGILGFTKIPQIGSIITQKPQKRDVKSEEKSSFTISDNEIGVVIKAKTSGSLEAIKSSLPENAVLTASSVGELTESDIFYAKASGSSIFVFEVKIPKNVKKLAENEGVEVYEFSIIYELVDKISELLDEGKEQITGKLEVLAKFPFSKLEVAGCKVIEGTVNRKQTLILTRNEKVIGEARIKSLRREKNEIDEAKAGEECGVLFVPQLEFDIGDILQARK